MDENRTQPAEPDRCQLCGRLERLTRHHLIPRMRHRNKRVRRRFDRSEMQGRILRVCRPCHNHIHHVLSEKELARHYNTRERLLEHPEMRRFITWIAERPVGFKPRSRRMRR